MIPNLPDYARLIKDRVGLHFDNAMEALLKSALSRRMAEQNISNYYEYFEQLRLSQDEFDNFITLITINETYFFRESDTLDLICDKWVPRLLRQRNTPLRILSAGCSSGEEAYSLAMKLHEKYQDGMAGRIEIYGCDIDPAILAKARNATYSSYSFRGVDPQIQQRYFTRQGNLYRLHDEIREKVSFHRTNIIKEQLLPEVDIILLRNVSIYFDTPTRRELHGNLLKMLHPQGALFFGNAETLANNFDILKLEQEDGIFYFCHHSEVPRVAPAPRVSVRTPLAVAPAVVVPAARPAPTERHSEDWLKKARSCLDEKCFSEAEACIASVLRNDPRNQEALLIQGVIALEQCEFSQTAGNAQKILAQDEWSAEAKMLLGLAMMWQHQTQQAIAWFKQVVYQEPGYWPAHYYLAEMYRQSELRQPAQRTYRVAMQLLNDEMNNPSTVCRLRLPMVFPGNTFRFLCEHQLAQFAHQSG
ncbi:chemotaxis protein CheR [Salmonella enterica subsp. enterica serovar Saintpaul]|nr:chemotaxis protein CheR [Salmonella enterica subsp. enterica serovar Saintpaul]